MKKQPKKQTLWDDCKERVRRGAEVLDEHKKGWVKELISNGKKRGYNLADGSHCVLGNVFFHDAESAYQDGYGYGLDKMGSDTVGLFGARGGEEYGFNIKHADLWGSQQAVKAEYQLLTEAWQLEVLARVPKTSRKERQEARKVLKKASASDHVRGEKRVSTEPLSP